MVNLPVLVSVLGGISGTGPLILQQGEGGWEAERSSFNSMALTLTPTCMKNSFLCEIELV